MFLFRPKPLYTSGSTYFCMEKSKVTLSLDKDTWKNFKLHCVKNDLIASDLVNDFMASVTTGKPRKILYEIKVKRKIKSKQK